MSKSYNHNNIKNKTDPVIRKSINTDRKHTAIMPVGSIEQHGPHLPISTDSDIVQEISKKVAACNGYHLCPTLTYGVSFEHAPFFNMSIKASTLHFILDDLCHSLFSNGIKNVCIINGHHGNQDAINDTFNRINETDTLNKLSIHTFSYWHFMKLDFDHAGFVETSLMLAISDKVNMQLAKKGLVTDNMTDKEIRKISRLAQKSFPEATGNGIWGDPKGATKEDGQKILTEIITNLAKKCRECLAT